MVPFGFECKEGERMKAGRDESETRELPVHLFVHIVAALIAERACFDRREYVAKFAPGVFQHHPIFVRAAQGAV